MLQFWMSISPRDAAPPAPRPGPGPFPSRVILDEPLAGCRLRVRAAPGDCDAALRAADRRWTLRIGRAAPPPASPEDDAEPTLVIDAAATRVSLFVPFSATVQLFQARQGDALCLSTDPRLLAAPGMELDPRAILCLLEFGALVPPLSLWRAVRRLAPRHWTRIALPALTLASEPVDPWGAAPAAAGVPGPAEEEERVAARIDEVLRASCPDRRPVILFSGGVDSGLLAARARALGWTDTLLANYRMGPEDPEGALAAAMARRLELPFACVTDDFAAWGGALRRIAARCPQPLGDYSMIPTLLLCEQVERLRDGRRMVWDGSGADGVFGAFLKLARWRRLYRLPAPARAAAACAYHAGGFWKTDHRLARRLAAARIAGSMPYLLASMIAENPLRGIAYRAGAADVRALHAIIERDARALATLPEPEGASRVLDLRHIVCDFTAQKDAPLFLGGPLDIAYPFLAPGVVRLGFHAAAAQPAQRESKAVLKRLLARAVPPEMVYRPKSGFTPPIALAFRSGPLRDALEEACAEGSPLAPWLRRGALRELAARAGRTALAHRTYNFLWTIVCTTLWLRQFGEAGREPAPGASEEAGRVPAPGADRERS